MRAAIIGGGAAGMYAAVMLAQAGHSVTIYEKNEKLRQKTFHHRKRQMQSDKQL